MNPSRISSFFARWLLFVLAFGATAQATPPALSLKTITSAQLVSPVNMTNAGDGSKRLFVCDQVGKIRIINDEMLLPTPFLDISSKLVSLSTSYDERGLLGLAFHPNYANPAAPGYGKFYVFYSAPSPNALANSVISAIAVGNPCVITTSTPHGLKTGNPIVIAGVTGGTFSPAINNSSTSPYSVTVIDANNFTVPVSCTDTTGLVLTSSHVYPTQPVNCRSTISEFQVSPTDPNQALKDGSGAYVERVVLSYDKPQSNHNGGQLAFGPDGYLYIGVGDGGSQHDNDYGHTGGFTGASTAFPVGSGNMGNAQDKTKLLGKILRIDPLGTNGPGGTYGIPASNPFVGAGGGVREEIYSFGMRNPWRFSFDNDPVQGWRLIEGDVGQDNVEEVNLIVSGGNYGWRIKEGTFYHDNTAPSGGGTLIDPVAEYAHPTTNLTNFPGLTNIGTAVVGGYVYRGSAIPALVGEYVFADYSASSTPAGLLLTLDAGSFALSKPVVAAMTSFYVTSFGVDEDGELYVATKTGKGPNPSVNPPTGVIYKIVAAQLGSITLSPIKDNSIYSESSALSNALGDIYAGKTANGNLRRGLLAFDIADNVPAGSTITSASLGLNLTQAPSSGSATMSIYRLSQSWGEGTSGPATGAGAAATEGDATWGDRFYDPSVPTTWAVAGGTHFSTASATASVGSSTGVVYTWSSAQMSTDVQGWLGSASSNNGWLLIGDESTSSSARAFSSRESAAAVQPALQLTYAAPPPLTWRETWLQQYFNPPGVYVSDTADANDNGVPNLFEYAYSFSPTATAVSAPGFQGVVSSSGGNNTYTMTFRRDPRAIDLTYELQTSNDLSAWTTIVQSVAGATPTGSGFVSESDVAGAAPVKVVTAAETLGATLSHFARLRVTRTQAQ